MRRNWVWGLVLATLGCHVGGRVDRFAPAKRPEGVAVALALRGGGTAQGELLAVQDTALVVLVQDTVTLVPYGALEAGHFSQIGDLSEAPPSPDVARRLRLISRFPQGLTPELLARLLAAHGQSALKVARRSP
jgi:hypothetical protein